MNRGGSSFRRQGYPILRMGDEMLPSVRIKRQSRLQSCGAGLFQQVFKRKKSTGFGLFIAGQRQQDMIGGILDSQLESMIAFANESVFWRQNKRQGELSACGDGHGAGYRAVPQACQ